MAGHINLKTEKGTITHSVEGNSHPLKVPEPDSSQTSSSQMSRQDKPAPERTEPRRSKRVPVPTNYYTYETLTLLDTEM